MEFRTKKLDHRRAIEECVLEEALNVGTIGPFFEKVLGVVSSPDLGEDINCLPLFTKRGDG